MQDAPESTLTLGRIIRGYNHDFARHGIGRNAEYDLELASQAASIAAEHGPGGLRGRVLQQLRSAQELQRLRQASDGRYDACDQAAAALLDAISCSANNKAESAANGQACGEPQSWRHQESINKCQGVTQAASSPSAGGSLAMAALTPAALCSCSVPRFAEGTEQQEARWLENLTCNAPLYRCQYFIPEELVGRRLISELTNHRVPMLRAAWAIKCSYLQQTLNDLRQQAGASPGSYDAFGAALPQIYHEAAAAADGVATPAKAWTKDLLSALEDALILSIRDSEGQAALSSNLESLVSNSRGPTGSVDQRQHSQSVAGGGGSDRTSPGQGPDVPQSGAHEFKSQPLIPYGLHYLLKLAAYTARAGLLHAGAISQWACLALGACKGRASNPCSDVALQVLHEGWQGVARHNDSLHALITALRRYLQQHKGTQQGQSVDRAAVEGAVLLSKGSAASAAGRDELDNRLGKAGQLLASLVKAAPLALVSRDDLAELKDLLSGGYYKQAAAALESVMAANAALAQDVNPLLLSNSPAAVWRALSLSCSSGDVATAIAHLQPIFHHSPQGAEEAVGLLCSWALSGAAEMFPQALTARSAEPATFSAAPADKIPRVAASGAVEALESNANLDAPTFAGAPTASADEGQLGAALAPLGDPLQAKRFFAIRLMLRIEQLVRKSFGAVSVHSLVMTWLDAYVPATAAQEQPQVNADRFASSKDAGADAANSTGNRAGQASTSGAAVASASTAADPQRSTQQLLAAADSASWRSRHRQLAKLMLGFVEAGLLNPFRMVDTLIAQGSLHTSAWPVPEHPINGAGQGLCWVTVIQHMHPKVLSYSLDGQNRPYPACLHCPDSANADVAWATLRQYARVRKAAIRSKDNSLQAATVAAPGERLPSVEQAEEAVLRALASCCDNATTSTSDADTQVWCQVAGIFFVPGLCVSSCAIARYRISHGVGWCRTPFTSAAPSASLYSSSNPLQIHED